VRIALGACGLVVLFFNGMLMLSDRAPGASARLIGGAVRRLSERLDASEQTRVSAESVLRSDSVIHLGVWALAVFFVAMAVWSWRGLGVSAVCVFAYSVVVELAQGRLSDTRTVQLKDVVFNGLGIAVGVTVALVGFVVWDYVAAAWANRLAGRNAGLA
jgi:VanZ family protein